MKDLFETAKEHFNKAHYKLAEPILAQLLESNNDLIPDVPYMLGTIAFEKGQLKKATQFFKQSLSIDPMFTESSVGLSIILNDLGKYEEARKVFEDAYAKAHPKKTQQAPTRQKQKSDFEQIAEKYCEVAAIYNKRDMKKEALNNYKLAFDVMPKSDKYKRLYFDYRSKNPMHNQDQSLVSLLGDKAHKSSNNQVKSKSNLSKDLDEWRRKLDDLNI